ncbi:class III extradiol ring-cleavage dioxygenase family protein [Goodfellowiella coeruleoviolacea]|uniref:Extradiol ring-cleavage dioxygenase class III enzyme subunit B domain-containing protein n=1 Tax=Goodfellowiella coeruleoviolacea TaxID=334858 RepID=A0AAE3KK39_9PSEU|nr:hypothetical protein [Goodfellowiella coeruleoviolacea]MCP2170285.1 hypothetical protein [Goodfellowiella coeruleoviolacea]
MIRRAVLVPHPPLLVPELVAGARTVTQPLRAAVISLVSGLAEVADCWIAVAADPAGPTRLDPASVGTFRGYGVDVRVRLSTEEATERATGARESGQDQPPAADLPLPALVAGWLRDQAGATRVAVDLVPPTLSPAGCRALAADLLARAAGPDPVGLLVLGDGSPRHGERAPGRPDDRAGPFDQGVHQALARLDTAALAALDPDLADELGAQGRAAWQVLAGVVDQDERPWRAVSADLEVPWGVGYHLARWDPVE